MKPWIVFVLLVISVPAWGAEAILRGMPSNADGVFFDTETANRMLKELEGCRVLTEEVAAREVIEQSLREEIRQREERDKDCQRAIEAAKSGGSWWERIRSAGKWIVAGAVVGFAFGAAR